jgi:hypothetical protein
MALAALPIGLAWSIGAHRGPPGGFQGYWERIQWPLWVIILPIAAFYLRWMAKQIGPVLSRELLAPPPPIIDLIKTKDAAYADLRIALLGPANLFAALLMTFVFHVVDMAQIGGIYLSGVTQVCRSEASPTPQGATERAAAPCAQLYDPDGRLPRLSVPFLGWRFESGADWPVAYLRPGARGPSKWQNVALTASAYSVQFAGVFIGFLAITLILRHNLFFLNRVYQRRRVTRGDEASYIHINIDDVDKCFGFRKANDAFNAQLVVLAIAGTLILDTRFTNAGPREGILAGLFPDVGQWLALLSWFLAMVIISLPMLVKLLPRLPARNAEKAPASLVDYLREFLSDEDWACGPDTPPEEIGTVAGQFAENAFWPTGDNRAWQLYFASFWVFFIALVPNPRAVLSGLPAWPEGAAWFMAAWAVEAGLAWIATWAMFVVLRRSLTFIDPRLVEQPAQVHGDGGPSRRRKIPISVFISYRRDDSKDITGRLFDSLCAYMHTDKLFMDLDKIAGGENLLERIRESIASAQAMIIVIGPKWLTPRIFDSNDWVHQEVAQGLKSGIRVLPVLVGDATIPTAADLPPALEKLTGLLAIKISNERWHDDVKGLVERLEAVEYKKRRRRAGEA